MIKLAFQSYLNAIHPRNIKEAKKSGSFFWFLYWCLIYPVLMLNVNKNTLEQGVYYACLVKLLPWALMAWSNTTSKYMMPKVMYLCPMTYEDRKAYVNAVLLIKIGVPVGFGLLIDAVWSGIFGLDVLRIFCSAFAYLSIGIATYFCVQGRGKNDTHISIGKRMPDGTVKSAWLNNWMIGFALGILLIVSITSARDNCMNFIVGFLWTFLSILLLILDILTVKTQYRTTIEGVSDYEENFQIRAEVPTNKSVTFDLFAKKKR